MSQHLVGRRVEGRGLPSEQPRQVDQIDVTWARQPTEPAQVPDPAAAVLAESLGDDWLDLLPPGPATDRWRAAAAALEAQVEQRDRVAANRAEIDRQIRALEDLIRAGVAAGTQVRRAAKDLLEVRAIRDLLNEDPPVVEIDLADCEQIAETLNRSIAGVQLLPSPGRPPVVAGELVHFVGDLHRWAPKPAFDDDDRRLVAQFEDLVAASVELHMRRVALREPLYRSSPLVLERRVRAVAAWRTEAAAYRASVERLARVIDDHDRARATTGRTHWCTRDFGWLRIGDVAPGVTWTLHAAMTDPTSAPVPHCVSAPSDRDPLATP